MDQNLFMVLGYFSFCNVEGSVIQTPLENGQILATIQEFAEFLLFIGLFHRPHLEVCPPYTIIELTLYCLKHVFFYVKKAYE